VDLSRWLEEESIIPSILIAIFKWNILGLFYINLLAFSSESIINANVDIFWLPSS
jgi:hypothetical protein